MAKRKNKKVHDESQEDVAVMDHEDHESEDDVVSLKDSAPEADQETEVEDEYQDDDFDDTGEETEDSESDESEVSGEVAESHGPTVYERLLAVARTHDPKFEAKQPKELYVNFVRRLCNAIYAAPEEEWNALPEVEQTIYLSLANAVSKGLRPQPIPGLTEDTAPIQRVQIKDRKASSTKGKSAEELAERETAREAKKKKREEEKRAKLAEREAKGDSSVNVLRKYIILNPHTSLDVLEQEMASRGIVLKKSTLNSVHHGIMTSLRLLRELDKLKD